MMTTTTTTTAAPPPPPAYRRTKRSSLPPTSVSPAGQEETNEMKRLRIFSQVLPYLAPVAHATNGVIPPECTFQGVCLTNRLLVQEFGLHGRPAGGRVTSAIADLLLGGSNVRGQMIIGNELKKRIEKAGLDGRNDKQSIDCMKKYPTCKQLEKEIHFVIETKDLPKLLEKVGEVNHNQPGQLINNYMTVG
jgi:hypothetical protein